MIFKYLIKFNDKKTKDFQYINYHLRCRIRFWYEHTNYMFTIGFCIQNRGKGLVLQNPRNSVPIFQYTIETLLWIGGQIKSNGETTVSEMITLHMQIIFCLPQILLCR